MILNELEFRYSIETLAKMYAHRDACAAETLWTESGRRDAVAGVENQIRKIEREIAEYLIERLKLEKVA